MHTFLVDLNKSNFKEDREQRVSLQFKKKENEEN